MVYSGTPVVPHPGAWGTTEGGACRVWRWQHHSQLCGCFSVLADHNNEPEVRRERSLVSLISSHQS